MHQQINDGISERKRITSKPMVERLRERAKACLAEAGGDIVQAAADLQAELLGDQALMTALVEPRLPEITRSYVTRIAAAGSTEKPVKVQAHARALPDPKGDPERNRAITTAVVDSLYRDSLLYSVVIDGVPLGRCTRAQVSRAERRSAKDAAFFAAIVKDLPTDDAIVGTHFSSDGVEAIWSGL